MKALVIAGTNLRRLLRDRSNFFFVFVFPFLLVLVLGTVFGGGFVPRLGVHAPESGALGEDLVAMLGRTEGLDVIEFTDAGELTRAVERGELEAGLIVPDGYEVDVRAGRQVELEFLARPDQQAQGIQSAVESAITQQGTLLRAARFAAAEGVSGFDEALVAAEQVQTFIEPVMVAVSSAGEPFALDELGQFDSGAQTQLVLFMFLTSLAGSAALIQTRRLGVARRMVATPTSVRMVLAGEGLGRLGVALIQGGFIMVGTLVIFGVNWGDPLGAIAVLLVFGLVGSGAAMLMGALFENDQQAGGLGTVLGLGLAALGGCMIPLAVFEILSPGLWQAAHITPHAWALRAFDELVLEGGGLVDILPFLGVLLAYALVFFALATWRLRVVLTR